MQEDEGNGTVAGEVVDSESTAQPGGATSDAPQQMSSSVGADESKPSQARCYSEMEKARPAQ